MHSCAKALLAAGAALAGMAYANHRVTLGYKPMHDELNADPDIFTWQDGILYYHVKGSGKPIVMLHDFTVGASAQQMQPSFDRLAVGYRVYAPDWLGYGQSTRPDREYSADLYEAMLSDFLTEVVREPAIVVASGPAAAIATRLAWSMPEKVERLVLIYPTGVDRMVAPPSLAQDVARWLLKLPVIGEFIYNVAASRPMLRWRLRNRIFFEPAMATDALVEHTWVAAHQPGAKWGPLAYWTGLLNRSVAYELASLPQETMIVWGQQAREVPVEEIQGFKRYRPKARYRAFDRCGQWPQYEAAQAFSALVRNWIEGRDHGAAAIFPGLVEPEDWA